MASRSRLLATGAVLSIVLGGCGSGSASSISPGPGPGASTSTPSAAPAGSASAAPAGSPASRRSDGPSFDAAACAGSLTAGDAWISLTAGGVPRDVLVHVPPRAAGARGYPALVAIHGYSTNVADFVRFTGLSDESDAEGFVVAYPQALGSPPEWHIAGGLTMSPELAPSDRELGAALLDWLTSTGCVDPARIFLTGHSQGGGMASDLTCDLADRLAGAALVSAVYLRFPCEPARPIPVIALHAVDDEVLPYAGGHIPGTPAQYPNVMPVEDIVAQFAEHNGCSSDPVASAPQNGVASPARQDGMTSPARQDGMTSPARQDGMTSPARQDGMTSPARQDGITTLTWQACAAPVVLERLATGGHNYWNTATSDLVWSLLAGPPAE